MSYKNTKDYNSNSLKSKSFYAGLAMISCLLPSSDAFVPMSSTTNTFIVQKSPLHTTLRMSSTDDDVSVQLAKAKELLAKAKAKLEEGEVKEKKDKKSSSSRDSKKEKVLKSTTDSGSFTTDGDMMAELSEEEEWEMRSLLDVFEEEFPNEDSERRATDKKDRDIAMAMFNLRKRMFNDDYKKIFNSKDWRIGELD